MASDAFQRWWAHFVPTGDICPLRLGMRRQDVEALFGKPDDFSADSPTSDGAAIWKFDDVELHFGGADKDRLILIFMDTAEGVLLSIGGSYGSTG